MTVTETIYLQSMFLPYSIEEFNDFINLDGHVIIELNHDSHGFGIAIVYFP
jgi:hypothetical protein